ncbi:hypothetical protein P9578_03745 [Brevibacillus choshinensis]|uniref:hypothetical protein n=1 Tax=Brevibacillus choshinensis TaxID=54911 RepID=UPI002E233897|nr:hypothetical protein [Brevibacillus choshinensis]
MPNQPIHSPKDYSEVLRLLEVNDPVHANVLNPLLERLLNNNSFIKAFADELAKRITSVQDELIVQINGVKVNLLSDLQKRAVLGENNQSINLFKATNVSIDTRSVTPTYTNGLLTKTVEKDGNTVVKTTELIYDANGALKNVKVLAGGKTATTTLNYNPDGSFSGTTKAVT